MKKFSRIYIEITNVCNLKCSFCIGNTRQPRFMTIDEFTRIVQKIKPYTDYIYLHILGEPLLHKDLKEFLLVAINYNLRVNITTNGTLLKQNQETLLESKSLRKVSISLHSLETNDMNIIYTYIKDITTFVNIATKRNIICEVRLWNLGVDNNNINLFKMLCRELNVDETTAKDIEQDINIKGSATIKRNLYLGKEERFEWPSLENSKSDENNVFCYGLRNQLGILCDGVVVPCCLDSKGDINLGNIYKDTLDDILSSQKSISIYEGFSNRLATQELCKKCGYAKRFK